MFFTGVIGSTAEKDPVSDDEFIKLKMVISKTFSCLEYLRDEDFVFRTERDGVLYWEAG